MKKPNVGDKVILSGEQLEGLPGITHGLWEVVAVHDSIEVWWDTPTGENKVALMDALDAYGPEKAKTAEWYAEVVSLDEVGASLAVASFEVEVIAAR